MDINIDTLILSGGGIKCVSIMGSLLELEKNDNVFFDKIVKYAGSSAGSIICALLCIGYTPQEVLDKFFSQKNLVSDSYFKIPFNLLKHGLWSGDKLVKYLKTLFVQKGISKDITFNELFIKTNKILVITGTSLNIRDTFYFNYKTFPNMSIIEAIRISMSIPLVFTSCKYKIDNKIHTFVDGAVLNNFPIYYFELFEQNLKSCKELIIKKEQPHNKFKLQTTTNENVLGIMLLESHNSRDTISFYNGFDVINNFSQYIGSFMNTVYTKIEEANFYNPITGNKNNFFKRVVTITIPINISIFNFSIDDKTKDILINSGKESVQQFYKILNTQFDVAPSV